MYNIGEHIVYGSSGPCLIADMTTMRVPGSGGERQYYVLRPVNSAGSTIYCPVDNDRVCIRSVLNRKEAKGLLGEAAEIPFIDIESEKNRETVYKEVLKGSDPRQCVGMIKTLMRKREERLAQGRKFTAVDEKYLREAMDVVSAELSLALGSKQETAAKHLTELLEEN